MDVFVNYVRDIFETQIKMNYDIRISRFPRHAIRIVRGYITQAGEDVIVRVYAVGGDGILFDCLNGLMGLPNAELASIPYGRGNDFIRSFGEGLFDLFRDVASMSCAPVVDTDVMHCGNMYSLLYCSIGIESDAAIRAKYMLGDVINHWPVFLRKSNFVFNMIIYICGFLAMFNRKVMNQEYTVDMDGRNFSGLYAIINMANSPCYGGDKNPVVTAMPNDGYLDVMFFKGITPIRGLGAIIPYLSGCAYKIPKEFFLKRAKTISIHSDKPLVVGIDGEMFFETNINVEVLSNAVKIVAPAGLEYKNKCKFYEFQQLSKKFTNK
jgi:diacylglycerol kinase family enzyme